MRNLHTLMLGALVLPGLALAAELPNDQIGAPSIQIAEGTDKATDPAASGSNGAASTLETTPDTRPENDMAADDPARPATGQGPEDPGVDITAQDRNDEFDTAVQNGDYRPTEEQFVTDATGNRIQTDDLKDTALVTPSGEEVGEIQELLVNRDGEIAAVVVDIGGFLGMGERTVAIDWNQIELQGIEENMGDLEAHVNMDRQALENAPEYDEGLYN